MNGQGQLQCQQDPKDMTRVGSVKELPLCREKPIFHEPVGALIKDKEQLTAMYPNSFNRIGSLNGEYTIKIDPSVAPVQQARCKVPIESKEAICAALDSMIADDILEPQIEPTPWVNSATYLVKPTGEVRPCLDCVPLNKAIIRENHTCQRWRKLPTNWPERDTSRKAMPTKPSCMCISLRRAGN